jgi:hypothetical protein
LPVTALTFDGKPVTNLQPKNVRVQGRDVQVSGFSVDANPRRIVLLIDVSNSMGMSNGRVNLLQAAVYSAGLLVDQISASDAISLYVFAERAREVVPLTRDFGVVRKALTGLPKPGGEEAKKHYGIRTDVGSALRSVLTVLSEHPQFGDAVVIFSDGNFPCGGAGDIMDYFEPPDYLVRVSPRLGTLGVRVFFSLAGNVAGTPPLTGVERFMGATGGESLELHGSGTSFYALNAEDYHSKVPVYRSDSLKQRAVALSAAIQDTYRLQLDFARPLEKPTRLRLDLIDEGGKRLPDVRVLSPEFVYPENKAQP